MAQVIRSVLIDVFKEAQHAGEDPPGYNPALATRQPSQAERGAQVKSNTITMNFSKARDKAEIDWGDGTPAPFHEPRSLSELLYKEQGINTQKLLGHKTQKTDRSLQR